VGGVDRAARDVSTQEDRSPSTCARWLVLLTPCQTGGRRSRHSPPQERLHWTSLGSLGRQSVGPCYSPGTEGFHLFPLGAFLRVRQTNREKWKVPGFPPGAKRVDLKAEGRKQVVRVAFPVGRARGRDYLRNRAVPSGRVA
jgi:hypothetical protein